MNMLFRNFGPLMMFYLLSEDIVERIKLAHFPRDPYQILLNQNWRKEYDSDYFQQAMSDTWAWLVWDHMGVRGGMEKYSGYDPIWIIAHAYTLWIQVFRAMGITPEVYFNFPPGQGYQLRYFSREELDDYVCGLMECFNKHTKYPLWRDVIKQNRCFEDFDKRHSSVKTDQFRKWYHTRTRIKSVDFMQAEEQPYTPCDKIISRLDAQRFIAKLEYGDRKILELLLFGYTRAEIAEKIGFANHSGISKRLHKIGNEYKEYIKVQ